MQFALMTSGALLASLVVHEGWGATGSSGPRSRAVDHATLPVLAPAPKRGRMGGHAVALVGYAELGFVVLNSWGPTWGRNGFALLPYDQWLHFGLDVWLPVQGVPIRIAPSTKGNFDPP